MFDQDLLAKMCNPAIGWEELIKLMHETIQAGIRRIGEDVAQMMTEPAAENFPVKNT